MQLPEDTIREIAYRLDDAALAKLAETQGLWTLITRLYKDNDFFMHRAEHALGRDLSDLSKDIDWKPVYYQASNILDNLQQPGGNDLWSNFYQLGMRDGGVLQVLLKLAGPVDDPGPTTVEHLLQIKSASAMKYLHENGYIKLDNALILKYLDIGLLPELFDEDNKSVLSYAASLIVPSDLLNGLKKTVLGRAIDSRVDDVAKKIIPLINFDNEAISGLIKRHEYKIPIDILRQLLSNSNYTPATLYDRLLAYILVQRPSDVQLLDTMIEWHESLLAIAADRVLSDVIVEDDAIIYQILLTSLRDRSVAWEDLINEKFFDYSYGNATISAWRLTEGQRANQA
ncbi:Hypothetical protein POVR2_LOCUS83 [uncultured virus]|nr:Hypothetical protein POVR2_LOCUS83 [uncultured virus]